MKILIENFKKFLHENSDPVFEKLKKLLANAQVVQAFELAASIDDQLLRDLLLEYSKMSELSKYTQYTPEELKDKKDKGEKTPDFDEAQKDQLKSFFDIHSYLSISELDEILEKIKEIVDTHGEHYDDMDRADISKLQNNIEGRKKRIKLFGPRKRR